MRSFHMLIKREFWEHKGSMYYTPAIMAIVFACLLILGAFTGASVMSNNGYHFKLLEELPNLLKQFTAFDDQERSRGVQMGLYAPLMLFGFVMLIISLFYALGSLYDERKDRSILFWKSLPISDTTTVVSKFMSITLLIPILYFAIIGIFQVFLLLFATMGAWFAGGSGVEIWAASNLFMVFINSLLSMLAASLWLAPVWAWLMLASSWAKKVAFLWGTLPILIITIAEGWVLHSSYFITMIGNRIAQGFVAINSNMHFLSEGQMFDIPVSYWSQLVTSIEFWAGLFVSFILLAAATYTRRYRFE